MSSCAHRGPYLRSNEADMVIEYGVPYELVTCWNCGHATRLGKGETAAWGAITANTDIVQCIVTMQENDWCIETEPHKCDICDQWYPAKVME